MHLYGEQLGGSLVQNAKVAQGADPRRQAYQRRLTKKKEVNVAPRGMFI